MRWLADCVGSRRSLMQFHGQQTTPCKAKAWMTDTLFLVRIKTLCHRTESFLFVWKGVTEMESGCSGIGLDDGHARVCITLTGSDQTCILILSDL